MALADNDRISSNALNTVISALWAKIKNAFAAKSHSHQISDVSQLSSVLDNKLFSSASNATGDTLWNLSEAGNEVTNVVDNTRFLATGINSTGGYSFLRFSTLREKIKTFLGFDATTGKLADANIESADNWNNKVDTASIDLSGKTTTIAKEIKDRYPANYLRFSVKSNGNSSGISDKPTGNVNWAFVAEARLVKNVSSSDYSYIVHAWADYRRSSTESDVADHNGYVCDIRPTTTACVWERELEEQQVYDTVGSSTKIPVITTNKWGQVVSIDEVTISDGGSSTGYVRNDSYNTFTQTQEIKRTGSTKAQLIIRNDLRDLRIGIDANGQIFLEDYADRTNSPSSNIQFLVTEDTGDSTVYRFKGVASSADTAEKIRVGDKITLSSTVTHDTLYAAVAGSTSLSDPTFFNVYKFETNEANPTNDGLVVNIPWNKNYGRQICFENESDNIWTRYIASGTWSSWKPVVTEATHYDIEVVSSMPTTPKENVLYLMGY